MSETPETEGQQKLRELQARRAAMKAAREAGEAERADARAIARAEQALLDEQALQDAIEKHGDVGEEIATVQTPLGLIIVKRASSMRFRRFQDLEKPKTEEVLQLVSPCVVHPTPAQFSVILDKYPAALMTLAGQIIALAGQGSEELAKK